MGKRTVSDEKKVVVKSLIDSGMPYRKVAEVVNVSLGHITKIVKEFEANRELIEWYSKNRAEVLLKAQIDNLALQEAIRSTITEEEIRKWTPDQKAKWHQALGIDFGIKFDKERLESNLPTDNLAIVVTAIKDAQKRWFEKQEREELGGPEKKATGQ